SSRTWKPCLTYGSAACRANDCASSTEAKIAGCNALRISSRALARTKIFTKPFMEGLLLGDDPLAKSRSDLVDLLHCLRRNLAITYIDQGCHLAQSILNLMNNWKIKLRHSLQPLLKIREQIRLVQQLCAVRGKMFVDY